MPLMSVWPILAKPPASLMSWIGVSPVAIVMNDAISDPVASVPMNESMRIVTTTNAFTRPIATPTRIPIRTASASGVPTATKCAAVTPLSVMVNANDRSNVRVASGTMTASAASAVIALALRTCLAVATFANSLGTHTAKTAQMSSHTYTAPMRSTPRPRTNRAAGAAREARTVSGTALRSAATITSDCVKDTFLSLHCAHKRVFGQPLGLELSGNVAVAQDHDAGAHGQQVSDIG